MNTTVFSDNGWWRATLSDRDDGVAVTIWAKRTRGEAIWKPEHRATLDTAFHVACDRVLNLINELPAAPGIEPLPTRTRTVSVTPLRRAN